MEKKCATKRDIKMIQDMYNGAITTVMTVEKTNDFHITIGLHQGSALNPYLFALVMDELTRHIQDEVPWCMLFADDIVLVAETKVEVNVKLELWREALESKELKISRNKTEYMECNFSKNQGMNEGVVSIEGQEISKSEQFRYLRSILHAEGDIGADVTHRIKA